MFSHLLSSKDNPCELSIHYAPNIHTIHSTGSCCNTGYQQETYDNLESQEISLFRDIDFSRRILFENLRKEWQWYFHALRDISKWFINRGISYRKRYFARYEFNMRFRGISYIISVPWYGFSIIHFIGGSTEHHTTGSLTLLPSSTLSVRPGKYWVKHITSTVYVIMLCCAISFEFDT